MAKEILVGFGIDVDAVAGWLGSYGGEDSPDDISRGMFAGEVSSPACLICSTSSASRPPGSSPATRPKPFPNRCATSPAAGTRSASTAMPTKPHRHDPRAGGEVLDKCISVITEISGKRPTGYVAPWWEFSNVTNELLLKKGDQVRPLADA